MEPDLRTQLGEMQAQLDDMRASLKKIQMYFQVTFWVTVIFFVAPLLLAVYAVPKAMNSYLGSMRLEDVQNNLQGLQDLYY